ncbi:MAG: ABC transporter permease [Armatimonadota bacterium]|nr:ABC transporter permease [Armatimonadota bacterium]MDR7402490.1 ABC transporter permease [Armatimonadota bacterium]MDR7436121.1 ABC transporter permease [Armatimonadota bacterium]MDR7472000.1 ABC transporter permease [Armatimonadota bacterium]MDR7506716.1 ABC transporter permease [Armatimonadota bacterium]
MTLLRALGRLYLVSVFVFLLAPVVVAVLTSFNPTRLNLFPPQGVSLIWYREFLQADNFTHAFVAVSLKLALIVAVVTGLLALPAAYALSRYRFRGRTLLQTLFLSPMMVPQMVVGIALLLFFARYTFADELRIVVGHTLIALPIAIRAITASLEGSDPQLEEAALSLGANPLQTFARVTAPLIGSGLLAAMLFAFTLSFTDVNVALFLTGPRTTTLPVEVFAYLRWESTPVIAAIAAVQVAMILVIALVIHRLAGLDAVVRY